MCCFKKYLTVRKIGSLLLLFILMRLVPFNILHDHNNTFANYDAFTTLPTSHSYEKSIILDDLSCTFDQYLTLLSQSFVVNTCSTHNVPFVYYNGTNHKPELESWFQSLDKLNKGSPKLT